MARGFLIALVMFWGSFLFAQQTKVVVQSGHTGHITAQLFRKDKPVLLTGATDGRIVEWELNNGWQIGNVHSLVTGISCMAFSADENLLAVGGHDNSVVLIDYTTKQIIKRWIPFKYNASSIAFTPDRQYLLATARDFTLWKVHLQTWQTEQVAGEDDLLGLQIAQDNKTIYFGCRNGSIYKADISKSIQRDFWQTLTSFDNEITEVALSPDGRHLAFGTAGHYQTTNDKVYGVFGVMSVKDNKLIHQVHDFDMSITPHYQTIQWIDNVTVLYANKEDSLKQWNLSSKAATSHPHRKCHRFLYQPRLKLLSIPVDAKVNVYRQFSEDAFLDLEGKLSIPKNISFATDSSLMVEYDNGFKRWDLRIGRLKSIEDKLYNDDKEAGFTVSHQGRYIVKNQRDFCAVQDTRYPEDEAFFPDGNLFITHNSLFSKNDRYLATLTSDRHVLIFDTDSSFKRLAAYKVDPGQIGEVEIPKMVFSPNEKYLAVLCNDIYLFDLTKRIVVRLDAKRRALYRELDAIFTADSKSLFSASHDVYSVAELPLDTSRKDVRFVPKGVMAGAFYLVGEPGVIKQWTTDSGQHQKDMFVHPEGNIIGDATALLFSDDGKILFVGTSDNRIVKLDIATGAISLSVKDHNDIVFGLLQVPGRPLLVSASQDGTIKIRDEKTLQVISTLFALKNHGYIITDSANYYKRSKNGASAIIFHNNDRLFEPEQYDIYFNQPHQVLKTIGLSSNGLIQVFRELHRKKLASISKGNAQPDLTKSISVEVIDTNIPSTTEQKHISLKVNVHAKNTTATSLVALVNGVPVLNGSAGQSLNILPGTSSAIDVALPLAKGINNISLKAYDANGIGSAERSFRINCKPAQPVRPNLYIVIASVSEYKDSSMNLKLAVKDGQDFLNVWKKDGRKVLGFPSQFGNIYHYTFFNKDATRENILAIKDSLKQAKEEDMVLLYVSGHGMLDTAYNFWYGTHDINFGDPAKRGLSYKELEGLLDNIKPLRKVMLMDACHSGEVDKSLIRDVSSGKITTGTRSKVKEYRYMGVSVKEAKDLGNTFEQMQEMFSNFNRSSGTVVISAAAGNGYAYEDAKWNNGVFTYALINGLRSKAADKNKDGDITIEELSAFVAKEVEMLTNGLQKPNERQENTKNSFRIW